jgi:hypothetical protein
MAVVYRAQCAVWHDSLSPKDAMMINPCFRDEGLTSAPQTLANDLAAVIDGFTLGSQQVRVRMYDVHGGKPNYPKGEKIIGANLAPASTTLREVAVCLSFYSSQNAPKRRGRLYVPYGWLTVGNSVDLRPTNAIRSTVGGLASQLGGLGGIDVDWVVYSETDDAAHSVTDWWVDDEWDIQRRRGLLATTRLKGTTTESGPFSVPLQASSGWDTPADLVAEA